MIRIAVCDDEKIICDNLVNNLKKLSGSNKYEISVFYDGNIFFASKQHYDIILLDIEMDNTNGMEIAYKLRKSEQDSYIIFLTSHSEFMPEAFKVNAFRFLEKPLKISALEEAIHSAVKQIIENGCILVRTKNRTIKLQEKDIICFEAFGDGTYIYTKKEVIETRYSLKYWMEHLNNMYYFQTHKSYIVALQYVKSIKSFEIEMNYLKNSLPVSHRKIKQFKESLLNYIDNIT